MESPPPYMPAPKKSNTGLIVGLIIGGFLLCCLLPMGLIGGFGFWAFNKGKDIVACSISYEEIYGSLVDYSKEHDGKLPSAATWMDDVRPYYRKRTTTRKDERKVFGSMPVEGAFSCNSEGVTTGMALNKDLAGKKLDEIKDRSTVLLFETDHPAENLSETYKEKTDKDSPKSFGKPRGWFYVTVGGEVETTSKMKFSRNPGGGINVRSTAKEGEPPKTPNPPNTPEPGADKPKPGSTGSK